ncbi:GNAT family N-acetyltransferase [Halorientalis marina]|uniref:GNAT family N-acetyltransferase n=1 Tax=Halorientalis marina TaxID=2931976 RepID=UPI001FF50E4F|nr:GNAT family N-acetyltransferase [Halorientalis marina]
MSDVSFRRASPADAEEILDIKREAIEDLEHWQYSPEQVEVWKPKDDYVGTFEQAIDDDQFVVHVAEVAGEIVGYGALNVPDERIDAVYVRPNYHGEGIATALVKHLELSAEFQGIVELDIIAAQNAVTFYQSVGYWQLEDEVATIEDVDLDFVRMRRRLEPSDPDEWFETEDVDDEYDEGAWADHPTSPGEWFDTGEVDVEHD